MLLLLLLYVGGFVDDVPVMVSFPADHGRYFQHAYCITLVDVGKRCAYYLVHNDLPRQHSVVVS